MTLTPFYDRVKQAQGRTAVRRVIATSIKEYLPIVLRVLFTLFKERKDGHRIRLQPHDQWLQDLIRQHRGAPRPAVAVRPDDRAVILSSGGTTGTPKGVVGLHRHYVAAGLQLFDWTKSAKKPWTDVIMLPLPLFHVYGNVGVQPLAFVGPNPLSLVPNPRDIGDVLATIKQVKPAFFSGVPTLYNAILNHPTVRNGQVDLSSIKLCFSGAAALDGGNQTPVRGEDRRANRRRLLADRRHDGLLREPGTGHEEARLDRHAAARRGSADRGRRQRRAAAAAQGSGRDDHAGAAVHGRVPGTTRSRRPRRCGCTPPASAGCTPATWPTWTRTATSSWWTARRT